MRMHNEQEINALAEEKINIEMEWEANIETEEGARFAERNELGMFRSEEGPDDRDKVNVIVKDRGSGRRDQEYFFLQDRE